MFSAAHFRDFLNEQWLIGPLALFFFLAAVAVAIITRQRWNRERIFLLVTGGSCLLACWVAGDSNLGYARNWDLLAPAGIVFLAGGLLFFCAAPAGPARPRNLLAVALVLSLFQFVPWVAINSSERLGVERVKALPLGGGRSEVMLGSWYLAQGKLPEARDWYHRAIAAYPGSHVAHDRLGYICLLEKKFDEAAREYLQAARLKDDWPAYQENAVNALIGAGRLDQALQELPILLEKSPRNASAWIQYCQLLFQAGRRAEALRAIDKALELDPRDARAAAIRQEIRSASSPDSISR
jgi:tetratricopeptide (TPR) repeat protein